MNNPELFNAAAGDNILITGFESVKLLCDGGASYNTSVFSDVVWRATPNRI